MLILPGLGVPLRRTLPAALHLVADGFTVVRYVGTNSVGASDGSVRDFTLTQVLEDLCDIASWASDTFQVAGVGIHAASISGRAALRAASRRSERFPVVGLVGCVVDVTRTLSAIGSENVVELWGLTAVPHPEHTGNLLGHEIRLGSLKCLIDDDWATFDSSVRDLQLAVNTNFISVHGGLDAWVSAEQVKAAFTVAIRARVVVLEQMGHEPDLSSTSALMSNLLPDYRAALVPLRRPGPLPSAPSEKLLVEQRLIDRECTRHWARH